MVSPIFPSFAPKDAVCAPKAASTKTTTAPVSASANFVMKPTFINHGKIYVADRKIVAMNGPQGKKRARDDLNIAPQEAVRDNSKPPIKNAPSIRAEILSPSFSTGKDQKGFAAKDKPTAKEITPKHFEKATSKSTGSTAEPPVKRSKGFKSRRGPSFQGAEAKNALEFNDVPLEFSTTCYYVKLGDDGQIFFIHEYHLSKSPRLFEEVKSSKSKLRKTQQQIIQLLPHDAGAFGQLVGYLYSDQFKPLECNKAKKMIGHRMKEIHEVMSLAKYYDMPGLQKDIMRVVVSQKLMQKVNAAAFFDWAEDMWYEEMDTQNGPFAIYLRRHAPIILQVATEKDMKSMMKFIGGGGDFVKEIFSAMHKALSLNGMPAIKMELDMMKAP